MTFRYMMKNGIYVPWHRPEREEGEVLGLLAEYIEEVVEGGDLRERLEKDFRVEERFRRDF